MSEVFVRRVLVVEDEREIAQSYQTILCPSRNTHVTLKSSRMKGIEPGTISQFDLPPFEVMVAHNAAEAKALVEHSLAINKPFAMGFFDVLLGEGMDGIELVKEVFTLDPDIFAVFVTAYHDRSVDSIHNLLGKDMADRWDYLTKPFTEGEIVQKARNAVTMWNLKQEKKANDMALAEANRRLLESDRLATVATVARSVGHEFSNILTQIIGRAELSLNGNEQELKKALETILKATETASHILERFKDLSKPSMENVSKELIWAHEPIDEAILLLDHKLKTENIRIMRIKNDKVQILACHNSLVQVYVNLIVNALHEMKNGGQIDFSITKLDEWVEVKVRDYGAGIASANLEKVFEPFFTTKDGFGTGLGLAICREIIEIEHEGEIRIANHSVKGAEAILRLPIGQEGVS